MPLILNWVDLGNTNLSGVLVLDLGKLQYIQYLRLSNNRLVGRIPRELVNVSTLKVV
ncbi:hypothetical protein DCAR_0314228 [Daucus carota subsp. sativus]|uniref:Uncharacterized protein n=1 Tax=Daucus carota subsp. sativus TaxID=79200 RepID=A0A169WF03_DAUCS|nr:hypothetical protein DCAR_0314228 [Daucus carota subsp. sativus]